MLLASKYCSFVGKLQKQHWGSISRLTAPARLLSIGVGPTSITTHLEEPTTTKINDYWLSQLNRVERAVARDMISKLVPENSVGYSNPSSNMLKFVLKEKEVHPDKVVIVRCGDFYEVYGIDAVMLVAHCGLNPMRGPKIVRAGCPVLSIQATLDGLTTAGLSAAIYEEIEETGTTPGPAGKRPKAKRRAFSYVVSPGCSVYPYKLSLKSEDIEFRTNRPFVGIHGTVSNGYNLVEIRVDEQCVTQYSRLSEQAIMSLLSTNGYVEPIYLQNAASLRPYLLGSRLQSADIQTLDGYSERDFASIVLKRVGEASGFSDQHLANFRPSAQSDNSGRPRFIYPNTATQIGLSKLNPNVPSLVKSLLPPSHYAHSARFLKKWLSTPPPRLMADEMRNLCSILSDSELNATLPSNCRPFLIGKAIQLLNTGQCNASVFREIRDCARGVGAMLEDAADGAGTNSHLQRLVGPLLALTSHQTGLTCDEQSLKESARAICSHVDGAIADAVTEDYHSFHPGNTNIHSDSKSKWDSLLEETPLVSKDKEVVRTFFAHNELPFRGHVLPQHEGLKGLYAELELASTELVRCIAQDFAENASDGKGLRLDFVFHDNLLCSRAKPKKLLQSSEHEHEQEHEHEHELKEPGFFSPIDRRGVPLSKRYTTARVNAALANYKSIAGDAPKKVEAILQGLCTELLQYQVGIVHLSNWALILQAVLSHTIAAQRNSWCLPKLAPIDSLGGFLQSDQQQRMDLHGLTAWWMDRKDPATVKNNVMLDGMQLLTAPNMSGKSTIMRATLVAALLANAGLFTPCDEASVPRYDSFFLRATSYDIPAEGKSAFALEMDDMHVVLRDSTENSLVMVDEIGRGTSSRDGASLAGALLERLSADGVSGIFSTHLHEVLQLPLEVDNLQLKCMGVDSSHRNSSLWTYKMHDGICTDSMGLETARAYQIPASVIQRAQELSGNFDLLVRAIPANNQSIVPMKSVNTNTDDFYNQYQYDQVEEEEVIALGSNSDNSNKAHAANAKLYTEMQHLTFATVSETESDDVEASTTASASMPSMLTGPEHSLEAILPLLQRLTADSSSSNSSSSNSSSSGLGCDIAIVEASHEPPSAFEGHSVVYLLHVSRDSKPHTFYVGETEVLRDRLSRHRSQTFKGAKLRVAVVRASNKGAARLLETQLISTLKSNGFYVANDSDGRHLNFGSVQ